MRREFHVNDGQQKAAVYYLPLFIRQADRVAANLRLRISLLSTCFYDASANR